MTKFPALYNAPGVCVKKCPWPVEDSICATSQGALTCHRGISESGGSCISYNYKPKPRNVCLKHRYAAPGKNKGLILHNKM